MVDTDVDWASIYPDMGEPLALSEWLAHIDVLPTDSWTAPELHVPPAEQAPVPVADPITATLARSCQPAFADFQASLARLPLTRAHSTQLAADCFRSVTDLGRSLTLRCILRLLDARRSRGLLAGDSPQARYDAFVDWFTAKGLAALDAHHPAALPRMRALVQARLHRLLEMFHSTDRHWEQITGTLPGLSGTSVLTAVGCDVGDTHDEGRAVAVLTADDGGRLVHKPRNLLTEKGFDSLTRWLAAGCGTELPTLEMVVRPDEGWVEFVAADATAAHPRYAHMMGVLTAALWLTDARDIHFENLRYDGTGRPVVIDAECLFAPELSATPGLADVGATGLFGPGPAPGSDFDPTAFGYRAGRATPFRSWRTENASRDDMRLVMDGVVVDSPPPLPPGFSPSDPEQSRQLARGFHDACTAALKERDGFIRNMTEWFDGGRVRYLHRPSVVYAQLLRMVTHPDLLHHPRDVARALGRVRLALPESPVEVLDAEILAMARGDVPAFYVDNTGRDIREAAGGPAVARLPQPPLERVLGALRRIDDTLITRQAETLQEAGAR